MWVSQYDLFHFYVVYNIKGLRTLWHIGSETLVIISFAWIGVVLVGMRESVLNTAKLFCVVLLGRIKHPRLICCGIGDVVAVKSRLLQALEAEVDLQGLSNTTLFSPLRRGPQLPLYDPPKLVTGKPRCILYRTNCSTGIFRHIK